MEKILYVRNDTGEVAASATVQGLNTDTSAAADAFTVTSVQTGAIGNDIDVEFTQGAAAVVEVGSPGDENYVAPVAAEPLLLTFANNTLTIRVPSVGCTADDIVSDAQSVVANVTLALIENADAFTFSGVESDVDLAGGIDEKRIAFPVRNIKSMQSTADQELKLIVEKQGGTDSEVVLNIEQNRHAEIIESIANFTTVPRLAYVVLADDKRGEYLNNFIKGVKTITY